MAIDFFFNPGAIAVIGASATPGKLSNVIMKSLLGAGYAGRIYPVNPNCKSVEGIECHPSVSAIKDDIDIGVFALPSAAVPEAVRGAAGRIRGAVIISGGFGETGSSGQKLEHELKDIVRQTGMRIIGPNCMGLYDTVSKVDTFFISPERIQRPGRGGLSIISQSGSFAVTAMDELAGEGIGVARVISYGNKADINEADCLEFLADDGQTTAVAVYIESVEQGRRFVEAASRCSSKKPVMAIKVGKTKPAIAAARSHTGSLAGRYEVYRAAFKKAGLIEIDGYEDFISGCKALATLKRALGRRVIILTDAGGFGVGIADACAQAGLEVAPLPAGLKEQFTRTLPPYCSVANPIDLTGSVTDEMFYRCLDKTLAGDDYDLAIVASLWGPPALTDELPRLFADNYRMTGKPVIVCTPGGAFTRAKMKLFEKEGLPVFHTPEAAVRAASVLAGGANAQSKPHTHA